MLVPRVSRIWNRLEKKLAPLTPTIDSAMRRSLKSTLEGVSLTIAVLAGLASSASATTTAACGSIFQTSVTGTSSVSCGPVTTTAGDNTATASAQAEAQFGVLRVQGSAQTTGVLGATFFASANFLDYLMIDSNTAFDGTLSFTYKLDGTVSEFNPAGGAGFLDPLTLELVHLDIGGSAGGTTSPALGQTNANITVSVPITSNEFSSTGTGYQSGLIELLGQMVAEGGCGANGDSVVPACSVNVNFFNTVEVTGFTIDDSSGNPVSGATLVADSGTNYNAIPQDSIAAAPEPSSLLLLGTGLVGGVGAIRRRLRIA